jgi:hypothetical protein
MPNPNQVPLAAAFLSLARRTVMHVRGVSATCASSQYRLTFRQHPPQTQPPHSTRRVASGAHPTLPATCTVACPLSLAARALERDPPPGSASAKARTLPFCRMNVGTFLTKHTAFSESVCTSVMTAISKSRAGKCAKKTPLTSHGVTESRRSHEQQQQQRVSCLPLGDPSSPHPAASL